MGETWIRKGRHVENMEKLDHGGGLAFLPFIYLTWFVPAPAPAIYSICIFHAHFCSPDAVPSSVPFFVQFSVIFWIHSWTVMFPKTYFYNYFQWFVEYFVQLFGQFQRSSPLSVQPHRALDRRSDFRPPSWKMGFLRPDRAHKFVLPSGDRTVGLSPSDGLARC